MLSQDLDQFLRGWIVGFFKGQDSRFRFGMDGFSGFVFLRIGSLSSCINNTKMGSKMLVF